MEHVCRISNHTVAVGLCLGLPASVSLSPKYDSLEVRGTNAGSHHPPDMDVDEQISQTAGPLHTASSRFAPTTGVHHIRLLTWADQS